jgi:peptide deformylase
MARLKGKARARASHKEKLKKQNDYFLRRKKLLSHIRKWDDPILKQRCEPVSVFDDVTNIVKELKSVLAVTDNGLGISASQIGYAKRIFVIRPDIGSGVMTTFINSNITEESKERSVRREGCLSYPDFYMNINRPSEVTISYEDESRNHQKETFKGMEACVILHEHDHAQGICLVGEGYYNKDKNVPVKETKETEISSIKEANRDGTIPANVEQKS